jgi:hypothetical protein
MLHNATDRTFHDLTSQFTPLFVRRFQVTLPGLFWAIHTTIFSVICCLRYCTA